MDSVDSVDITNNHKMIVACVLAAFDSGDLLHIGVSGKNALPWKSMGDMKGFREVTIGDTGSPDNTTGKPQDNAVIMGLQTWRSIPAKWRVLPKRLNIVLTSSLAQEERDKFPTVRFVATLDAALKCAASFKSDVAFIAGGRRLYEEAIQRNLAEVVFMTHITFKEPTKFMAAEADVTLQKSLFAGFDQQVPALISGSEETDLGVLRFEMVRLTLQRKLVI